MKLNLNSPIEDLDLSVRAYNCLKRGRCITIEDILALGEDGLHRLRNLGPGSKTANEIVVELKNAGFEISKFGEKSIEKIPSSQDLKENGLKCLDSIAPKFFKKDSECMKRITHIVEVWLNKEVEEKLKEGVPHNDIETFVEGKMNRFKKLVEDKRKLAVEEEIKKEFASSMKAKISEIAKYKHKEFEKEEGHGYNPFLEV